MDADRINCIFYAFIGGLIWMLVWSLWYGWVLKLGWIQRSGKNSQNMNRDSRTLWTHDRRIVETQDIELVVLGRGQKVRS